MQINTATKPIHTHEGAKAKHVNRIQQLRRAVMSCMLWEDEFYECGECIADRIVSLCGKLTPEVVEPIAIEAREDMKLRHVPLLMLQALAKTNDMTAESLARIIQRPDELCEFLAIYWRNGRCPVSSQVKKGLAAAFNKFDAYQLAKYNRNGAIKLRDVLCVAHPKPKDDEQSKVFKQLLEGTLAAPDTWEVSLSGGADKKETFTRMIRENKLGGLAMLRNLRNMNKVGVSDSAMCQGLDQIDCSRVLPFRFITAAKHAVNLEPALERAFCRSFSGDKPKLNGKTVLLVDVSGSMLEEISGKSEVSRMDCASGLAMIVRELCDDLSIYTFSKTTKQVPARRGFALRDAIVQSLLWEGTFLGAAVSTMNGIEDVDRLIVITDEQSHDTVPDPVCKQSYMVNVASAQNGVGYGPWTHIDGWSESIIDYIQAFETRD